MKKLLVSLFWIAILLSGCATSLPSVEAMKADSETVVLPKLPEANMAMIYVFRPSQLGGLVRFNVFVNDQEQDSEVGYTRGGQYIYFQLKPGTYKILSKAENWAETVIEPKADDILFIQQEPSMGFVMARNSIFKVAEYEGKYHIKRLSPGTIIRPSK